MLGETWGALPRAPASRAALRALGPALFLAAVWLAAKVAPRRRARLAVGGG